MRLSEAKACIKELYLKTNNVTAMISERGIGKTSAYKQCAKELGIGYVDLYGAALEGPDFMGLPNKDEKKMITTYFAPQFLPTKQAVSSGLYPERGLLVIEELNRVPSDTMSVLYPLLLDKKINGHALAEGWKIGVTMNPDTMNYMVGALDDAMLDRFIAIEIEANLEDYLTYSKENNGNVLVMDFLKQCPDMLMIVKNITDTSMLNKAPTPRGWTNVQGLMNDCKLNTSLMKELIAGIVGLEAATTFYGFLEQKHKTIPSAHQLLESYTTVRKDVLALIESKDMSSLNQMLNHVLKSANENECHKKNLESLIVDLPLELQVVFYKKLSGNNEALFNYLSEDSAVFEKISEALITIVTA